MSCRLWKEKWGHNVLAQANDYIYFWNCFLELWGDEFFHAEPRTGNKKVKEMQTLRP